MRIVAICKQIYRDEKPIFYISAISLIAALAYVFCMLIYPFFVGGWKTAHAAWYDWQTFNAGILAYFSTLILFYISRYHALQQQRREFIAARSFLPHALSELTQYLKECASLLSKASQFIDNNREQKPEFLLDLKSPEKYIQTFEKCIALAQPQFSVYLSQILIRLQINQTRLEGVSESIYGRNHLLITKRNINSYFFRLAELQCLINAIFAYSRGMSDFELKPLDKDAFINAYACLEVFIEHFDGLDEFTDSHIGVNPSWQIPMG
ncbi:hypothetical protein [Deefgea rivuli]|uniref:hypothetical protein n=1 Tax=Deefgea rivuli TaxID=400948 RepID=UPI0004842DE6|nr:hypothetical protein [Deefgea rivuli]